MASVVEGAHQLPSLGDLANRGRADTKKIGELTKTQLLQQADNRKAGIVGVLRELADSVDQAAQKPELKPLLHPLSGVVRQASSAIENANPEQLLIGARQQFRTRPAWFLAGLVAFGFLAGRIIRD